jgi:hypothetical protein
MKKLLKSSIMLVIDSNASPTAIIFKLGRSQLVKILDRLLPDDKVTDEQRVTISEAVRRGK